MTPRTSRLLLVVAVTIGFSCTFNFDRELAPGEIRGTLRLVLPDGGFAAAAEAHVRVDGSNIAVRTDKSGRFVIRNLPGGNYRLRMRHERTFGQDTLVSALTVNTELAPSGAIDLGALSIDAPGALSGVVHREGEPDSGLVIVDTESMAESDFAAGYRIPMVEPGQRRLAVRVLTPEGLRLFQGPTVDIRPRLETVRDIEVEELVPAPASWISVRVRLADGADANGVDLELHDGQSMFLLPPTDASGFVARAEVPAGVYTVVAKKKGYLPSRLAMLVVMGDVTTPDLILAPEYCRPGVVDSACSDLADGDADGDGIPDYRDHCPNDPLDACAPGVDAVPDAPRYCGSGLQDNNGDGECRVDCGALPCGPGGVCADTTGTAVCACETGHGGDDCGECLAGHQDNDEDGWCSPTCAEARLSCGHGACDDEDGTARCHCDTGYAGADCSLCDLGYANEDDACVEIEPLIVGFFAQPSLVTRGDSSLLTASFTGGAGVITPGLGEVSSDVAVSTGAVEAATEFTLTVTSLLGKTTSDTVTVDVVAPPAIGAFKASRSRIVPGESVVLTAEFSDATGFIDQGVGDVLSQTPVTTPSLFETTVFTLTVTNAAGTSLTRTVTVELEPLPEIHSFVEGANPLTAGETTTLTAVFTGGTGSVSPDIGAVTSGVAVTTGPVEQDVTYTLTVTTPLGQTKTRAVELSVFAAPVIEAFTASPTTITEGATSLLTMKFSGGTGTITPRIGGVFSEVAQGTGSLFETTDFTLTVTNVLGRTTTAVVTVVAVPEPVIASFTAGASPIRSGDTATLTALFSDGQGEVDNGVGAVSSGAPMTTPPLTQTTVFTLTVTNPAGDDTREQTTVEVEPPPSVDSFVAADVSVTSGEATALTAVFSNGTGSIEPGIGAVTSGEPVSTGPLDQDVEYTLTVTTPLGATTTRSIDVSVIAAPSIEDFRASPPLVTEGSLTLLTARFSGGTGQVDQGVGEVVSGVAIETSSLQTTTDFKLTVTNGLGRTATDLVTVTTVPAPDIASFTAVTPVVWRGQSATLRAEFSNGAGDVDHQVGPVSSEALFTTPALDETTVFRLTVTNAAETSVTREVTVEVQPPPVVRIGGNDMDRGTGVAVDGDGDTLVVGTFDRRVGFPPFSLESQGQSDVFVAKLARTGEWLWASQAGGSETDTGWSIAVGADGHVWVAGEFNGTATFGETSLTSDGASDIFVARLSPAGEWLWAKRAGGPFIDSAQGIVVDAAGNARVTGYITATASFGPYFLSGANYEAFVATISPDGDWLGASQSGGAGVVQALDLAVDATGHTLVTGYFTQTVTFGSTTLSSASGTKAYVAKLSPAGQWVWAAQVDGTGGHGGHGITVDASGHPLVTGRFDGEGIFGGIPAVVSDGGNDIFVAKLSPDGAWLWVRKAGGVGADVGRDIEVDVGGDVLVTGSFEQEATFGSSSFTSAGHDDVFVSKLSSDGDWLWTTTAGGTSIDRGASVATDANGHVRLTGEYCDEATFGSIAFPRPYLCDGFVASLDPNGEWANPSPPPSPMSDDLSQLVPSAPDATANGSDFVTLTVRVHAANGVVMPGVPVTFVSNEASDVFTVRSGTTNASGELATEVRASVAGVRTFHAVVGWPAPTRVGASVQFNAP